MQGTTSDFGNINKNLWHSTVIGGTIKLITLCPYVSFEPGGLLGVADNPCYVRQLTVPPVCHSKQACWLDLITCKPYLRFHPSFLTIHTHPYRFPPAYLGHGRVCSR